MIRWRSYTLTHCRKAHAVFQNTLQQFTLMLHFTTALMSSCKSGTGRREIRNYPSTQTCSSIVYAKVQGICLYANMHTNTQKKEMCGGIRSAQCSVSVASTEYWMIRFRVSTLGQQWAGNSVSLFVCVCVVPEARSVIVPGLGVLFQPWSVSVHSDLLTPYLNALKIVFAAKSFGTLSHNHLERMHHFEGNFTNREDQGRSFITLLFLSCPLCCCCCH